MPGSRFVTTLFLLVFAGVCLAALRLLWVFVTPIVLALILVSLFLPVHRRLLAALGGRKRSAAAIATALVVLVVVVPLTLFATTLVQQAASVAIRANEVLTDPVELEGRIRGIADRLPMEVPEERVEALTVRLGDLYQGIDESARTYLREHLGELPTLESETEAVEPSSSAPGLTGIFGSLSKAGLLLYQGVTIVASNAFSVAFHFFIMVVVLFALFLEGTELKQFLMDLSPLPDDEEQALVNRFSDMSRAVFFGNGTASLLQGVFGGIGFAIFGIGPGMLWGAAIAFLAFLPIVGAMVVFIPVTLYLLLTGEVGTGVLYLVYNMIYVVVLEYGLKPRLIGERVRMHSVLVFLGILAGLSIFGLLGIFYGPLILAMFLTLVGIYRDRYRGELLGETTRVFEALRTAPTKHVSPGDEPAPPADAASEAPPDPADEAPPVRDPGE